MTSASRPLPQEQSGQRPKTCVRSSLGHGPAKTSTVRLRSYYFGMPVRKLSVALEESVADAAKQAAKRRGMSLSAWLNEASVSALETEVRLQDGLAGVAEWEAEHGPISAEELAKADAVLDAAGIGRKREPRRAA